VSGEFAVREFRRSGNCPPESGGQRDRKADPARGGSQYGILTTGSFGTTPALRATPPDAGGELLLPGSTHQFG
jgi:hypothetical protein